MENFNSKTEKKHRIISIDYGSKNIGIAMFFCNVDPFPYPYKKITYRSDLQLIEEIMSIITNENISVVVVGVPLLWDRKTSKMSRRVINFGNRLKKTLVKRGIPIHLFFQDEMLTSKEAESRMRESPRYNFKVDKEEVDKISALIILEDFLNQKKLE